jgi:hypothetical protein
VTDHHREHGRDDEPGNDLDTRHPADVAREEVRAEMEARGESLDDWSPDDDKRYREEYERSPHRLADLEYDRVRPAYQLGHRAAGRSEWRGRPFEEIEAELQKDWTDDHVKRHGDWSRVRPHVSSAYRLRSMSATRGHTSHGTLGALPADQGPGTAG